MATNLSPPDPAQTPETTAWMRYCVKYLNENTLGVVHQTFVDDFANHKDPDGTSAHDSEPSFEVVKSIFTRRTDKRKESNDDSDDLPPPISGFSEPNYSMRIHSAAILNALRSVVKYYPSERLVGSPVTLQWPYAILCHHYEQLSRFSITCRNSDPSTLCKLEKDASSHIDLLLGYLDEAIMPQVRAEQERNARGLYTWDWYWVSHMPGRTSIYRMSHVPGWHSQVIYSIQGGAFDHTRSMPRPWILKYWGLELNGSRLVRVKTTSTFSAFDGEQLISDNTILPNIVDDKSEPNIPIVREQIRLGGMYWDLMRNGCRWHSGKSLQFPYNETSGLVMVDPEAHREDHPHGRQPDLMAEEDVIDWVTGCGCAICQQRKKNDTTWEGKPRVRSPFADYEHISKHWTNTEDLSWHTKLLCPKKVPAFVFQTRNWETVSLSNLSDPPFDATMVNFLEMEAKQLNRLKALAMAYCRKDQHGNEIARPSWSADFVQGKGKGLTFLLHGKPGVGKTWTAECIAEFTKSPLMILNTSDIGTDAVTVESNLTKHFKRAKSWGAVLLIDEADIFMERRSTRDLERNSLVAGFLRALEFYDGILFLTTNRVGAFDDAFISRIHVQLYYKDFTDEQRQNIWKNFAEKLKRERGDSIRLNYEAREYLQGTTLRSLQWNGREIRNAFQTAVSLAEYEAIPHPEGGIVVTEDHLKAVVELSKDFKEYLEELHSADEGKRALGRQERLDL